MHPPILAPENPISDEKINVEPLGARVMTLTTELHCMESRFSVLESRFPAMEARLSGIESRLGVMEDRMSSMLSLIVRIADRLDGRGP